MNVSYNVFWNYKKFEITTKTEMDFNYMYMSSFHGFNEKSIMEYILRTDYQERRYSILKEMIIKKYPELFI